MKRVMIVEDHTLVRQTLAKVVSAEPGFTVVGEADRGDRALEAVRELSPDVVVLDIGLPGEDGLSVAQRIKKADSKTRVLFLTMHDEEPLVRQAISLGADGYVPKSSSTEEFLAGLRAVSEGQSYISPSVARQVLDMAAGRGEGLAAHLTPRELEILRLLASGARIDDVAAQVYLSPKTVKNHLTNIYAKLGVGTAAQAVVEAYRLGVVPSYAAQ